MYLLVSLNPFKVIEIAENVSYGYLLTSYCSPKSNGEV